MRSTLDELTKEMEQLRALVASIAPVNAVLAEHKDSLVRDYVLVRRRYDYAAFAVVLYASFEAFMESLVTAYAKLESQRVPYTELPAKLVRKHLSRTADLLARGRIGEGRYVGLTALEVVKNLFECLNGTKPYTLNEAAVVAHDLNLRGSEIDALFASVGIENICERVRRADALLDWYRRVNGLDVALGGVSTSTVEGRIKDVVERRNQIAHRGGNLDDLLGVKEMDDAIDFILAFAHSVFAMTVGRYLRDHHAKTVKGIHLTQRQNDGPYRNGKVVIIDAPTHRLFRNQPAFVLVETTGARWGRILSIQINGGFVDAFEPGTPAAQGIGVELDFQCPKGTDLFALAADDELVWSPTSIAPAASA